MLYGQSYYELEESNANEHSSDLLSLDYHAIDTKTAPYAFGILEQFVWIAIYLIIYDVYDWT